MGVIVLHAKMAVDVVAGALIYDPIIVLRDDRITAVGRSGEIEPPDGALELRLGECALIPGLIDCHTHLNLPGDGSTIEDSMAVDRQSLLIRSAGNARAALDSGITLIGECGAAAGTAFAIRDAAASGLLDGPQVVAAGAPLTTPRGHCWMFGGEARGPEEVRAVVAREEASGADWIKLMASGGGTRNTDPLRSTFTVEEIAAARAGAHERGKRCVVHATNTEAIRNSVDAKADIILHCFFYRPDGVYSFDAGLAQRIADAGIWVNPTLQVARSRVWRLEAKKRERPLTAGESWELEVQRRHYAERHDMMGRLHGAGVRLAAGSDSGWSYCPFGSFAYELEAMAAAGLGAMGALQAGTIGSAAAMGKDREVGSLTVGKRADVVALPANPLRDLRALLHPYAIFRSGRPLRPLSCCRLE